MTRKQQREQAFGLIFGMEFHDIPLNELLETAKEAGNYQDSAFSDDLIQGVADKLEAIDETIKRHVKGWRIERLSKVSLAVLRLAIFEMVYREEIPVNVSINEAVELSKKFGGEDDSAYINGVLGSVAKQIGEARSPQNSELAGEENAL